VQRQAYAKKADTKVTQRIVHGAALGCGRAR
jgi:hypothetical protein